MLREGEEGKKGQEKRGGEEEHREREVVGDGREEDRARERDLGSTVWW